MTPTPIIVLRRLAQIAAAVGVLVGTQAYGNPITLDNTGAALNSGGTDANWTVWSQADQGAGSPISATVGSQSSGWISAPTGSQWITELNYPGNATIDYYTTFSLTDANASTVSISGSYGVDNALVDVFLNGHSLGITNSGGIDNGNSNGYVSFTSFTIGGPADASYLNANGSNTLEFETYNGGDPGGLMVKFSGATYSASVPDSGSTAWLLAAGCFALLLTRRQKGVNF